MTDEAPPRSKLREVRILVWVIVALAIAGIAALLLVQRVTVHPPEATTVATRSSFGGPFTDLDVRGAGDLLGSEQSGHVKLVGTGLYQHLF